MNIYIYGYDMYVYEYICMCVCVYVCKNKSRMSTNWSCGPTDLFREGRSPHSSGAG